MTKAAERRGAAINTRIRPAFNRMFALRRLARILVLAAVTTVAIISVRAERLISEGWWVILRAFPAEPAQRQHVDFESVNAAAALCKVQTFNDMSNKFRGFRPGYNVFVLGAFSSHAQADPFGLMSSSPSRDKSKRLLRPLVASREAALSLCSIHP
jgi:hypothetical protein